MSEYKVNIEWRRNNKEFVYESYDRTYLITFAGGKQMQASNPPEYFGKAELPNPEELLLSALAGCYMQTFLAVAYNQGFIIDNYYDSATAITGKNEQGKNAIIEITLSPRVRFEDKQPSLTTLAEMRDKAHKHCFISNSINSKVTIDLSFVE